MMGASRPALRVSTAEVKDPLATASQAKRVGDERRSEGHSAWSRRCYDRR